VSEGRLARVVGKLEREAFLAVKRLRAIRDGEQRFLLVSGVQRSGTNMIMDLLEASPDADVYHETDPRAFENYMMRDEVTIARLMARSPFALFVLKGLHEAERARALIERFGPGNFVWVFRNWPDVVNSNMRSWPGGRNQIENVVRDPGSAGWRGRGMTPETHAIVREAFRPGMNDASAQTLFYVYRNQLLFDQQLDRDPRTLVLDYDAFVADPGTGVPNLARFAGVAVTERMIATPSAAIARRKAQPDVLPHIAHLADAMHARLMAAASAPAQSGHQLANAKP
jgi:hypothetical protein